jgi:aminodeoxyfutalosine deaminase
MRKISADFVYPISSAPIKNGVVVLDKSGKILAVDAPENHDFSGVETHKGILVPGFINTHCHLELSHMKGKVATGTRGIVAVGDISNVTDTFTQKEKGRLRYYTFLEMFDFLQEQGAEAAFAQYKAVYDQYLGGNISAVPHAPYSVSKKLFSLINQLNSGSGVTVSLHNQETQAEQDLFLHKKGGFIDFYGGFGISLDAFEATKKTAIHYALANMNPKNRTLFVHNTLTTVEDIKAAQKWSPNTYWATCANANLYIENRLPNYQAFIETNARMTIGTDSLTSNWQLSVIEELKTIQRFQSYLPFETLLKWATLNGAEALGYSDTLGSIEVGKTPGLNLVTGVKGGKLGQNVKVKRLGV